MREDGRTACEKQARRVLALLAFHYGKEFGNGSIKTEIDFEKRMERALPELESLLRDFRL